MFESPRRAALRAALPIAVALVVAPLLDAAPAIARDARPTDATVQFELVLDLQDEAGAEAFATAVSTPGDPQYRRFLAPADWIARFAPTQATFDAAVADLTGAGLTVAADQPASREYIVGSGPASVVAEEFGAKMHTASFALGGRGVHPLLETADARTTHTTCSTYWNQHTVFFPRTDGVTRASTPLCGYTPAQLRQVTGIDARHGVPETGSGVTIAVLDAFGAPGMGADLQSFSARNHLPAASYRELVADRGTWQQSEGCRASDWQPEQALDLEAAHSVAPGASLLYVGAADCAFGFDLALSGVLDGGLADVVSNSFGTLVEPDAPDLVIHQHLQAAGEGIGLVAASGDDGDESALTDDGGAAVGFPASSPWVTAVGGTTVALGRKGDHVFETAWGDMLDAGHVRGTAIRWDERLPGELLGGAGGGMSALFDQPWYQARPVPSALSKGARTTSDVAALASPYTGFLIGYRPIGSARWTQVETGGTSLAAPIVAAELALAEQRAGHRLGFANPALYAAAATFRDVRPSATTRLAAARHGSALALLTLGRDTSLAAHTGYDLPTGLGSLTPATIAALAR